MKKLDSGRFDYIKYNEKSMMIQSKFKEKFIELEEMVILHLVDPRAKALTLTKLEEAYMWVGKAIRDDQIMNDIKKELQEERNNS